MTVGLAIFANVALAIAALGYGSLLCRFFPRSFSPIDRFGLTVLSGLGLLGTLLFDVGQEWFSQIAIVLVMLPGVILGVKHLREEFQSSRDRLPPVKIPIAAGVFVGGMLLFTAIAGTVRPVGSIGNDSIAYHFLGPKTWLRDGLIRPIPEQSHTAMPALVEAQYGALMALGGERAPDLFAVIAFSSILVIAAGLMIRLGLDSQCAWWGAALIMTMPAVYTGGWGGFIDVLYAAFVLAAARVAFDAEQASHYVLIGLLCGFAVGTKYTGIIASLLLGVLGFILSSRTQGFRQAFKWMAVAAVVALTVSFPVYLRNLVVLGCPIYPPPPLLSGSCHPKYMSAAAVQSFIDYVRQRGQGLGRGPGSLLLLPFNLTYHTANFNGGGGIGLAPLGLGPIGVIATLRDRFARQLALFGFLLALAWFLTDQESRFLIHVYVLGAIFAVLGWRQVTRIASRLGSVLAGLVVACSLCYGSFMIISARSDDFHSAVSSSFARKYRQEEIPYYESIQYLNSQSSVRKVLVLDWHVPTYYLNMGFIGPGDSISEHPLEPGDDASSTLSELRKVGVSHVLDVKSGDQPFRLPKDEKGLTLVFEAQDQRVYRLD